MKPLPIFLFDKKYQFEFNNKIQNINLEGVDSGIDKYIVS